MTVPLNPAILQLQPDSSISLEPNRGLILGCESPIKCGEKCNTKKRWYTHPESAFFCSKFAAAAYFPLIDLKGTYNNPSPARMSLTQSGSRGTGQLGVVQPEAGCVAGIRLSG